MSINTDIPPTDGPNAQTPDRGQTELSVLRRRVANKVDLLHDEDPELYEEGVDWLHRSAGHPDGSIGSAVNSKLRELKRGNKMRDHRGVDDPTDAFPEDCKDCEFYGVACPMVGRHSVKNKRERIIRNADSDEELVNELTDLAIDWGCDVVLGVLEDFEGSSGELLQEGYQILFRATEVLHLDSESGDGVATAFADGPSPADREQMEETISAVMGDEESDAP